MRNIQLTDAPAAIKMRLEAAESPPAGSDQPWLWWRSLNRLRAGVVTNRNGVVANSVTWQPSWTTCTHEGFVTVRVRAKESARKWQYMVCGRPARRRLMVRTKPSKALKVFLLLFRLSRNIERC